MSMHLSLVAILVPDYDSAIAYFTKVLEFELLEDSDLGNGKRWVRVAPKGAQTTDPRGAQTTGPRGAQTAFLLARAVGDQRSAIGQQGGGRVWLFLHTNDFDQDYARLSSNGVRFNETPRCESYGKVAVFTDAFGNRWDLLQLKSPEQDPQT